MVTRKVHLCQVSYKLSCDWQFPKPIVHGTELSVKVDEAAFLQNAMVQILHHPCQDLHFVNIYSEDYILCYLELVKGAKLDCGFGILVSCVNEPLIKMVVKPKSLGNCSSTRSKCCWLQLIYNSKSNITQETQTTVHSQ